MTIFLDKKERVYDLRLTSYGKYLLSIGKFKPVFYGFYDNNILYDDRYGRVTGSQRTSAPTGENAGQNYAHKRIKQDTQYLESLVSFEQVEGVNDDTEGPYRGDMTPTQQELKLDAFRFDSLIGDAYLDADSKKMPAWKIVALDGAISSTASEDEENDQRIPQLDMTLIYRKKVKQYQDIVAQSLSTPSRARDLDNATIPFKGGQSVVIEMDDALLYIDEINTTLLNENFDIEAYEVESETSMTHASGSLFFVAQPQNNNTLTIHNNSATEVLLFKSTLTDPAVANEVEIGGNVETTVSNLAAVINTYLSSLQLSAKNETTEVVTKSYLYVTNQYNGTKGNLPRASFNVTGVFAPALPSPPDPGDPEHVIQFHGGVDSRESLRRMEFSQDIPQIVDGMMLTPKKQYRSTVDALTTSSVEYFFDLEIDQQIDPNIACNAADIFNKQSYYIDLDFDCESTTDDNNVLYDIYGPVTEPEICAD